MIEQYDHAKVSAHYQRVRQVMEDGLRSDGRFRMLVDSCVAAARHEYGRIDTERADRGAYDYATFAAAMLLARVYDEDGELAAMRAERDHYRKVAEQSLLMQPMVLMTMPTPKPETT